MYGKFGGRLGLILLLLGLMVPSLRGQGPVVPAMQSLGEEPYGAYSLSATESVNLNNGNNNIVLTLASLKGRNGQDLSVTLSYNTKQIIKTNTGPSQYQYALAYTGWTQGQWVLNNWPQRTTYSTIQCLDSTHFQIKPYTLIRSPDGATHEMHPTTTDDWIGPYIYSGTCPSSFIWPGPNPNYRSVTGTIMEFRDGATPNLYLKNGNRIDFTSLSAIKAVDTNGNITTYNVQTSLGPLSVVDNLGRTINYSYTGNLLTQVTVTGANGQIQTYSFEYDTLHVNTQMQENCPAPCVYTLYHMHQDVTVLKRVWLPNGLKYEFEYDRGPMDPDGKWTTTLKLAKITYPVGGYSRYDYTFVRTLSTPGATDYVDKFTTAKYRNALDGKGEVRTTWSYVNSQTNGNMITTTVTNPDGGYEVHNFSNALQTSVEYRRPSDTALLRKIVQDWISEPGNDDCNPAVATRYNARVLRETRFEYNPANGNSLQSKVEYDYDANGYVIPQCQTQVVHTNRNVIAQREFDFGLNTVGSQVRQTLNTYLTTPPYNGPLHILDRITSKSVYDTTGPSPVLESQTNYRYDEWALTARTGATGHDDTNYGVGTTARGNLTSLAPVLLGTPNRELVTQNYYDILGNIVQVTPPRGYSTLYDYTDRFSDGVNRNTFAYVTQVTKPATQSGTHIEQRKYYFPTGQLYQAIDENNQTASVNYDSVNRPTTLNLPDGGQTSFSYADAAAAPPAPTNWEFTTPPGDAQGWTPLQQLAPFTIANSTLQTTSQGTNPQMQSPAINLSSASFKLVVIRMQVSAGTQGTVYFQKTGDTGYSPAQSQNFTISNNTDFVTYYIDLSTLATWTGQIVRLRIDPTNASGANIAINYIRVYGVGSPSITRTQLITATANWVNSTYFDGLGRKKRAQWVDPAQGDVLVDTEYDSLCGCPARTFRQSNPYRTGDTVRWTTQYYDLLGRVITVVPPDGTANPDGSSPVNAVTYTYGFSSANRLTVTIMDQAGKKRQQEIDALGRTVRLWEPNSGGAWTLNTDYTYDSANKVKTTIQGVQQRTFIYDSLGRLLNETHPESGATAYGYDDNGNTLTKTVVGRNIQIGMTYDELDRMLTKSYTGDLGLTPAVTYGYDDPLRSNSKGRLTSVGSAAASRTFNYDVMGRTLSESQTVDGLPFSLSYTYNLIGDGVTTTYPNGMVITNTYNAANRITQVSSSVSDAQHLPILAQNLAYAAHGALKNVNYGNTLIGTRNYNSRMQLSQVQVGVTGSLGSVIDFGYTYNENVSNNGQVARMNNNNFLDHSQDVAFTYDELTRLLTAEAAPGNPAAGWGLSWTYDRYGNRTAQNATKGAPPTSNLTISPANNQVSGYTYDGAGNLTLDSSKTYTYDGENRLVKITQTVGGATTAQYSYDANNQRVKKIVGATTTYYFFGRGEYSGSTWQKLYVGVPGARVEYNGNGTMFWYHLDRLGTTRAVTDINGNVVVRKDYYPFGEEITSTTNNEQKFTGYYRDDESGMDYAVNRYYNSSPGRFMSIDPYPGRISNPQSLNRYTYVLNNPINFTDRNGTFVENDCGLDCYVVVIGDSDGATPDSLPISDELITQNRERKRRPNLGEADRERRDEERRRKAVTNALSKVKYNVNGTFKPEQEDTLKSLVKQVANLMESNSDCAGLFGGFNKFISLLGQTLFNYADEANPNISDIAQQAKDEAGEAGIIRKPDGSIEYRYGLADIGGHRIYLNHRFFRIATVNGQLTGLIHELLHNLGRNDTEIEKLNVERNCGTKPVQFTENPDQ